MANLSETRSAKLLRRSMGLAGVGLVGFWAYEQGIDGTLLGAVVAAGLVWVSRELTKKSDISLK